MKPRERYQAELEGLRADVLRMAGRTEQMIADAMEVLANKQVALYEKIQLIEEQVDNMDLEIERRCMSLLARQQPVARDLRTIGSVMKMIADIERCADYAVDIAKAGVKLAAFAQEKPCRDLPAISNVVQEMLRDMLLSFVHGDLSLVREVCARDGEVDAAYRRVRDQTTAAIAGRDERAAAEGIELVLCARYLERIADHVVNIGERILYIETGVLEELDP